MKYKVLCSDLDGTLLSTKSDVSDFAVTQIHRIKNETRVILVSARMPSGMRYLQQRLGIENQPMVCYNGALVLDQDKVVISIFIPLKVVRKIFLICKPYHADIGVYVHDQWLVSNASERVDKEIKYTRSTPSYMPASMILHYLGKENLGAHKLMVMGTKESADALMPVLEEKFGALVHLYRSNNTLIEIAPKSVSKLTAIEKLLKDDERMTDVVAFGDNYNDIEMLQKAGLGVAVGNAREEVKAIADKVIQDNVEDGVAHFIEKYITT